MNNLRYYAAIGAALISGPKTFAQFTYGTAGQAAQQTGMERFISGWGGTALLIMIALGVIGLAWIGVELMFFDKEIRDVKKGLIGAAIMIVAPAVIYGGINAMGQ